MLDGAFLGDVCFFEISSTVTELQYALDIKAVLWITSSGREISGGSLLNNETEACSEAAER